MISANFDWLPDCFYNTVKLMQKHTKLVPCRRSRLGAKPHERHAAEDCWTELLVYCCPLLLCILGAQLQSADPHCLCSSQRAPESSYGAVSRQLTTLRWGNISSCHQVDKWNAHPCPLKHTKEMQCFAAQCEPNSVLLQRPTRLCARQFNRAPICIRAC